MEAVKVSRGLLDPTELLQCILYLFAISFHCFNISSKSFVTITLEEKHGIKPHKQDEIADLPG